MLTTRGPIGDKRVQTVDSVSSACELLETAGAREVYIDGGRTVQSFLSEGLIDEITVTIAPVVLGSERPLFGPTDAPTRLRLLGTHVMNTGMVAITYDVERNQ